MDTSGRVDDFTDEVETALGAFDSGAIHVVSSIDGVHSHSITIDKQMIRYELPRLIFLNNIDHKGANPWEILNQVVNLLRLIIDSRFSILTLFIFLDHFVLFIGKI
jgi:elongation factor G